MSVHNPLTEADDTYEPVDPVLDLTAAGGNIWPKAYAENGYLNLLVKSARTETRRVLLGLPVTGLVRVEFMLARYGVITPCNWSMGEHHYRISQITPLGYDVKDARNVLVQAAVLGGFEWLFFLDHDVILPPETFLVFNEYIRDGTIPLVSGLYFTKSHPGEPLVYRGRGTSYYSKFKLGDKVWCDGTGCGCLLISTKLLKLMYDDAPEYIAGGSVKTRMVFETPKWTWHDPESGDYRSFQGTEDLAFFDRVVEGKYLQKAGFTEVAKRKYYICCDTRLFCKHIDQSGMQYPLDWRNYLSNQNGK